MRKIKEEISVNRSRSECGKMENNKGRILTLLVKITDHDTSKWIWQNHVHDSKENQGLDVGLQVYAIMDGDQTIDPDADEE